MLWWAACTRGEAVQVGDGRKVDSATGWNASRCDTGVAPMTSVVATRSYRLLRFGLLGFN